MGAMIKTPMTREEACLILNIDDIGDPAEPVDYKKVLERFEILFEKNSVENQGSFYIRSKIFFAKEHLMMDWPKELNVTKFDQVESPMDEDKSEAEKQEAQSAGEQTANAKSKTDRENKHPNKQ